MSSTKLVPVPQSVVDGAGLVAGFDYTEHVSAIEAVHLRRSMAKLLKVMARIKYRQSVSGVDPAQEFATRAEVTPA